MGYHEMHPIDIYSIYRRYQSGQPLLAISREENVDRKTIRDYLAKLAKAGLNPEDEPPPRDELLKLCNAIIPERKKRQPSADALLPYEAEIRALTTGDEPLKPKTAFRVIVKKYGLSVSYSSFKRFFRRSGIEVETKKSTIRIELPCGREIQVDYGYVGLHYDPVSKKKRKTYAFVAQLSYSRLPFIQFVYTQNQESFCSSFIAMFEYYGGAPEYVTIDNLKSGVIKPDLYEPKLNLAFSETMDHYGVFVNTARVATPKDKPKVERMVPVARERFREFKALHDGENLKKFNEEALKWCREEYGRMEHGTTGVPPLEAFELERPSLQALPEERFAVPVWKQARVHLDQFVQFEKKRYSLPREYRQKDVMVKKTGNMVHIYHDFTLIRQYVIPRGHRAYEKNDFPPVIGEMMEGDLAAYLLRQARQYGESAYALIESVTHPQGNLNARRAQGLLAVMDEYRSSEFFSEICEQAGKKKLVYYKEFRAMFANAEARATSEPNLPMSSRGEEMVRDAEYYLN